MQQHALQVDLHCLDPTFDTFISDNEVGASTSRIHGLRPQLCYRRPRKDSGLDFRQDLYFDI